MAAYTKTILLKDTSLGQEDRTRDFYSRFLQKLEESGLSNSVQIVRVSDIGIYNQGLVVKIMPDNIMYANLKDSDIQRVIDETIKEGRHIAELEFEHHPRQLRIVLRNCGAIDPEDIKDYIAVDGYLALKRCFLRWPRKRSLMR